MSRAEPLRKKGEYYEIKEGSFRVPADKDTSNVIKRAYKNPRTGEEGVAYELGYETLTGLIEDIRLVENTLQDNTVLKRLHIVLDEDENGRQKIISMPQDSRYAEDMMKKLPNIDFAKEVQFRAFDFISKKTQKRQAGIALQQEDNMGTWTVRIMNAFEKLEEKDGKKVYTVLNGFPEATEEDRDDWKFYFMKVNKFLIKYTKENVIPKLKETDRAIVPEASADAGDKDKAMDDALSEVLSNRPTMASGPGIGYAKDEINPDDIPF